MKKRKVMKRSVVCLLAVLLPVMANAQTRGYSTNFTFSQRNFADTIPIEVVDNQIFVKARQAGASIVSASTRGQAKARSMPVFPSVALGLWEAWSAATPPAEATR